jgi:hypothetical protein
VSCRVKLGALMAVPGLCLADEENGHQVTRF